MSLISKICGREVLDSRGNPTVEAEVILESGACGYASVPSGASTGRNEACELRDKDRERYHGKGVLNAVKNVNESINLALKGVDALNFRKADSIMIALDGTRNKSNLGANAILSVSLATARAGADYLGLPLYRFLGGFAPYRMPVPMMNILNGGAHAENNVDIQEFMIIPVKAESFAEAVRMCSEVYHTLRNILTVSRLSSAVGDEGGFAPNLASDEEAIKLILKAISETGYEAERDFMLGLDIASSEWWTNDGYIMPKKGLRYTSDELIEYLTSLTEKYPVLSIEDGVGEEDYRGWKRLTERLSPKGIVLVGDDLFVTDPERVKEGICTGYGNAVLVKPNQIGTLSESLETVSVAKSGGFRTVMSHRSGDTEDSFIADLSVALGCDFIKTGAPVRSERCAKYNRLMKIERELSESAYGIK